jgi:hypothetical protein
VHLHGHHFSLLYKGSERQVNTYKTAIDIFNSGNTTAAEWTRFQSAVAAQAALNPMQRDTLMAEKFQLLIIAFLPQNPGVWALQ